MGPLQDVPSTSFSLSVDRRERPVMVRDIGMLRTATRGYTVDTYGGSI